MTGERSLMKSGDRTSAGRSPACSEPSVGSKRTRTTSPRSGLPVDRTVYLRLQRRPLLRGIQVYVPHLPAAFFDVAAERLALPLCQPSSQELRNYSAPLAGAYLFLEPL